MSLAIDWKNIKNYENSQNTAFEEVVCQLAYNENKNNGKYTRVKAPDGGVESYLTLENGNEIGWQAKYFFDIQDSQFTQIKKSFETAITKHPNLIEYYVCCPLDRQDPRIPDKKYLQDRWNDFVQECHSLALAKGITIKIEYWGAFELNNMLQKPENAGMVQFWFGGDNFSKTWFAEQTNTSIKDLGARYSAELNVEIHEITHEFNALLKNKDAKTHLFEKLNSLYKALKDLSYLCNKYNLDPENQIADISSCLDFCWKGILVDDLQALPFKKIQESSENLINKLSESSASIDSKDNKASFRNDLYKLRDAIDEIKVEAFNLFNHPCLVVFGDAGIGKSHLLGDFANNLIKQGKPCVFILGQKLTETINPWTQVLKNELRLDCNEDVFLGVLNTIGQAQQERVLFIIDALNEGKGRSFWGNTLAGFIEKFKKYPWVALLLSVRSEYKENILANIQQDIKSKTVSEIKHYGFQYNVFEAVQSFFDYYQLALPTEPLLTQEFNNPLFLKIYCEYRRNTQTDDFETVITDVFDNYFWSINVKVATDFGYRPNLNYVQKILNRLAEAIFNQGSQSITYEEAMQIVDTHTQSVNADAFLQILLSKNLLTSYQNQKDRSEILYFSYELFYDYLTAKFICEENTTTDELIESFSCRTLTIKYKNQSLSQGVLGVLSVLIPTQFNVELFEVLDKEKIYNNYSLGYAFIDGLYWRNSTNLNLKSCTAFVNKNLFQNDDLFKRFINLNYQIAGKENHPLNANKLHDWLSKNNLVERDTFWTTVISGHLSRHSAIFTLIDWAIKQGFSESLTKNSRYLTAIAISWIFTSTNIALRDNATIALTRLLQNNIDVSVQLLSAFEKVDDPYVLERILASIYGAILSSQNFDGVDRLCHLIINQIFSKEEVYPNVLVRDFSRNIIEFAHIKKIVKFSSSELKSTRPPYNSSFPKSLPSNEDIDDKYAVDYSDEKIPDYRFAQGRILSSMTTEYGRGMCMYGDFGRYVFQSRLRNWEDINIDKLSNYAVEIIFEKFGYAAEKHGELTEIHLIQVVMKITLNVLAKNINGWLCMKWLPE